MNNRRVIYRYVDDVPLMVEGFRIIMPGQFISKALYERLPEHQTIKQEIRYGES